MNCIKYGFCALSALLCLAACDGGVRDTLGLDKKAPDEFRVVSRPPLSVPEEFYLYPPDEAKERGVQPMKDAAKKALFESGSVYDYTQHYKTDAPRGKVETALTPVGSSDLPTISERTFLGKLGAAKADPAIRKTLEDEAQQASPEKMSVLDRLQAPIMDGETVVDAQKERERLIENKQKGRAVNDGAVPEKKEQINPVLDWLF
ncbi:MAG: DUF3035 domain-containing protein [Alphaproteobacteria bacterium]|nr:MAG: DUF3035 domain-containing protein [Alphaproteobacteria bacterium]